MSKTQLNNSTDIGGHADLMNKLEKTSKNKLEILEKTRDQAILNFNQKLDQVLNSKDASESDKENAEELKKEVEVKIRKIFENAKKYFLQKKDLDKKGHVKTSSGNSVNAYTALFAFASITKGGLSTLLDVRDNYNPIDELNDGEHDIDTEVSRSVAINAIMDEFKNKKPGFYKQEVDLSDTKK